MSRFDSKPPHHRLALLHLLPLALGLLGTGAAADQTSSPRALPPIESLPEADMAACQAGTLSQTSSAQGERAGREICYSLAIDYTKVNIYNPAEGKDDIVSLRSYVDGSRKEIRNRIAGPTILMRPGQTVRINLQNNLREDDNCAKENNAPDCKLFNETNLHAHGLWISPSGNSDNVLLTLKPKMNFQYEYNVPEDHPAGTFWYHPHLHGSTAIQVGSGMAGALIIKGERLPRRASAPNTFFSGDIDTLLQPFEPQAPTAPGPVYNYPEVLLLQQIPYACFTDKGAIATNADGTWSCAPAAVGDTKATTGTVEKFATQFGGTTWDDSGRHTLINGVVHPQRTLQAGRLHRFRLILAGVSESIALSIRKATKAPEAQPQQWSQVKTKQEEQEYVKTYCSGDEVPQWEVAADGLTRSRLIRKGVNHLQPGYRSDVLIAFPEEGDYCVFDASAGVSGSIGNSPEKARMLALVSVKGGTPIRYQNKYAPYKEKYTDEERAANTNRRREEKEFIKQQLLAAADKLKKRVGAELEGAVLDEIKRNLNEDLSIALFAPHQSLETVTPKADEQTVVFNIATGYDGNLRFTINDNVYSAKDEPRTLVLNTVQDWVLRSQFNNHPFHIHVNPFQIIEIKASEDGGKTYKNMDISSEESQYYGMLNTWKDTLFVQGPVKDGNTILDVQVKVRTQYRRYIGDFVLHCHILDHEDMGMMQNVRIVPGTALGAPLVPGHHASHGAGH